MNNESKNQLNKFLKKNNIDINSKDIKIAELGSFDINGNINNLVNCTKFDIFNGKNVDVCINEGEIPEIFKNIFDYVITLDSFQFCEVKELFLKQIFDLLKKDGICYLQMCNNRCIINHSSSPITKDQWRLSPQKILLLLKNNNFKNIDVYETEHSLICEFMADK
jgi:SAM-dependent methyltransferase